MANRGKGRFDGWIGNILAVNGFHIFPGIYDRISFPQNLSQEAEKYKSFDPLAGT